MPWARFSPAVTDPEQQLPLPRAGYKPEVRGTSVALARQAELVPRLAVRCHRHGRRRKPVLYNETTLPIKTIDSEIVSRIRNTNG